MASSKKLLRRNKVRQRIRKTIAGTPECPRLAIFRSNKQIYAQIIDDLNGKTLAAASSAVLPEAQKVPKIDQAKMVGSKIAEIAKTAGIAAVVFDRGGYLYHGRVKSLAEAAREGGLKF